ncbi:5773_t:CDS:1, partial [Rhizophagus irregularis]
LYEYNKYIDEVYVSVNNISNRLSTSDNYSYVKNKERKSRNLFPSFKNKLNDILLKHADKFGFVGYQEQYHPEASSSSSQPSQPALSLHQEHIYKKTIKKSQ